MKYLVCGLATVSLFCSSIVHAAEKEGSVYVQCDGRPNTASALGTVARLIAITAVIGLFLPPEETADPSKRKEGQEGVAACDAALNGEEQAKDGGRRIELFYGRAIHNMELERWDEAIADLRAAEADQPELVATEAYNRSLGQTALFLEAMALTGKGDYTAARNKALLGAERAPYDFQFMLRAIDYARLVPSWDAQTESYYDQLVRLYPPALSDRADARAIAGDFVGAADDLMHERTLNDTMPKWEVYHFEGVAAVGYKLAGEDERSAELIAGAIKAADAARGNAEATTRRSWVSESKDYLAILERLNSGNVDIARTLFSARSEWEYVPVGFVMELASRINEASPPELREKMPMKVADDFLEEHLSWSRTVINDAGEGSRDRWRMFRQPIQQKVFDKFSRNTWRTEKSKYLAKEPAENWNGTLLDVSRNGDGLAGAYALYLHAALMAKQRGHQHFMVLPSQRALFAHYVRLGDPGDKDIVEAVVFDADKVVADLSPYIPRPEKRRRR